MHEDCGDLVVRIFDLKNFFPEVPHAEFDALLRLAICLLLLRNPRWRFFCLSRLERRQYDCDIPRATLRQGGWRTARASVKKKTFFSDGPVKRAD